MFNSFPGQNTNHLFFGQNIQQTHCLFNQIWTDWRLLQAGKCCDGSTELRLDCIVNFGMNIHHKNPFSMAHYRRDMVLRNLMKALKVNWVVCSTEDGGLNEEQIVNFNKI
jgi:hypothetical protein